MRIYSPSNWGISVKHPKFKAAQSAYWMDRSGPTVEEAIQGYLADSDNLGADLAKQDPELTIICGVCVDLPRVVWLYTIMGYDRDNLPVLKPFE